MKSDSLLIGSLAAAAQNAQPELDDSVITVPPLLLNAFPLRSAINHGIPLSLTSDSVTNNGVIVQQVGAGAINGRILTLSRGIWEVEIQYSCICTAGGGGTMVEIVLSDLISGAVLGLLSIGQFSQNMVDRIKSIFCFRQSVLFDITIFGQAAATTDGNAIGYAHRLL